MPRGCWGALMLVTLASPLAGQSGPAKVPVPSVKPPAVIANAATPAPRTDNLPAFVRQMPVLQTAPDPGPPPASAPLPAIPLSPRETLYAERGPSKEIIAACKGGADSYANPLAVIKACDVYLSYPAYEDIFWPDRGAMLLRRGRLLLQLGLKERAFETFDLASSHAASKGDPFWNVSGGLADRFTRIALRFGEPGGEGEARQLTRDLFSERPFSPSHLDRVHAFLSIGSRDPSELIADYEREARIDPRRYLALTRLYLLTGKFDLAARAAGQITLSEPHRREGWSMTNGATQSELLLARLNMLGLQAYAAAASGDDAGKAAYFAAARQQVGKFLDPIILQTISGGDSARRTRSEPALQGAIAEWEQAIQLRQNLTGKTVDQLLADWTKTINRQPLWPAYMAMLAELGRQDGESASMARKLSGNYLVQTYFHRWNGGKDELVEMLPTVETQHWLGKFDQNLGMWFDGSQTGFSQTREPGAQDDVRIIHYEAGESTREMAEELLALAIARYARKDKYDGFVILSRHTIDRVVHQYGQDLSAGYDAQAKVLMVRGGQFPAGSTLLADRVIKVDEVDQALGPRFARYAEYQARKRAEEKAREVLRKQAKKAAKQ